MAPGLPSTWSALTDPAQWETPPADSFDRLLGTIRAGAPQHEARPRRLWLAAAAVVLFAAMATAIAVLRPNDDADWRVALAATTEYPDAVASIEGGTPTPEHESESLSKGLTISPTTASTNSG